MGAVLACISTNLCECAICMSCSCLGSIVSSSLGQAARFGHLLIFVAIFLFASLMGGEYQNKIVGNSTYEIVAYVNIPDSLNLENLISGCDESSVEGCVYNQIIYRASFTLTAFFGLMAIIASYSDSVNRGMWSLKILATFGCFIGFWWGSNDFFNGYAELARVMSFFWLLIQALLVLDVAHDLHDIVLHKAQNESDASGGSSNIWHALYLLLSAGFLACGHVGLDYMYAEDEGYTGCKTGMFFVTLGVIISITQLCVSALNSVNGGIMTPSIMFAYATFMTWYALLSSPDIECNPTAYENNSNSNIKRTALGLVVALSLFLLAFCVVNGSTILQIFNASGSGVLETGYGGYGTSDTASDGAMDNINTTYEDSQSRPAQIGYTDEENTSNGGDRRSLAHPDSTGTSKERMFFHGLMCLASCYGCMILTSWGKTNGAPEAVGDYSYAGAEGMWLKMISTWVFYLMYFKALHLMYQKNSSTM